MRARVRQGTTLVEVLVAIFVMALGLIALLTLFPLGALRMMQAIQDDRCGLMAGNAAAAINAKNLRTDPEIMVTRDAFNNPVANDPYALPIASGFTGPRPLDVNGPSYPVLVDPNGYQSLAITSRHWAPANIPGVLSRRNVSFGLGTPGERYRWFNLLDDITFYSDLANPNQMGRPLELVPATPTTPATIEREYRFSWAYMLQKPRLADPAVIECSVVIFKNRSFGLTNESALNEFLYDANPNGVVVSSTTFDTLRNTVNIDYSKSQAPPLRVGAWLCDVSYGPAWQAANLPFANATPHGTWYRVVNIIDNIANSTMEVELQQPLRGFPATPTNHIGTVLIFEGVVEVFERGPGR